MAVDTPKPSKRCVYRHQGQRRVKHKHCWLYYQSSKTRECIDCGYTEKLWADFGIVKRTPDDEQGHHPGQEHPLADRAD